MLSPKGKCTGEISSTTYLNTAPCYGDFNKVPGWAGSCGEQAMRPLGMAHMPVPAMPAMPPMPQSQWVIDLTSQLQVNLKYIFS